MKPMATITRRSNWRWSTERHGTITIPLPTPSTSFAAANVATSVAAPHRRLLSAKQARPTRRVSRAP
jgi:hypothetical protein